MTRFSSSRSATGTPPWDRVYEWKVVLLLALSFGLVGLDRWILGPLFPAIMADLDLDYADLGMLVGGLALAWGIFSIVMGNLSDRLGRRAVLIPALVVFSALSAVAGFATGFLMLLFARTAMGAAEGAFLPASVAATGEASHPHRRGLNQGLQLGAFSLFGFGIAPIMATQLLVVLPSWREVFMVVALPGFLLAYLLHRVLREPTHLKLAETATATPPAPRVRWTEVIRARNVQLAAGCLFCTMSCIFVVGAMVPNYLIDHLKLSPITMGLVMSGMGWGGFLGGFMVAGVSDVVGRRRTTVLAFIGAALSTWFFWQVGADPWMLFFWLSMTSFFALGLTTILAGPIATEAVAPSMVSSSVGVIAGAGEIFGGGIAPVIAGFVAQRYGIDQIFWIPLVGLGLGVFLAMALRETAPRQLEPMRARQSGTDPAPAAPSLFPTQAPQPSVQDSAMTISALHPVANVGGPAHSGTFERRNPMTGEVATQAPAATVADAIAMADAAAQAFASWSQSGPNARRALLNRAADALVAKGDAFVSNMAAEIGATEGWARFNLMLAVGMVREAAALTTQIGGEVIPSDKPGCLAMALREPAGVVLGIAPWNAPVILGVRAIAVPLACGNTVILKASEVCPGTHGLIVEAFVEAGFPKGVVNVITNAPADAGEVVGALIDHPGVRRVNFTGSTAVGRIIARRAADTLKPVLLELGGKAPLVVLEDADLDEAVKAAAFGAFMNQGQICMSTERIIVVDAVADAFVERFQAKVATLTVGDPREGKAPLGVVVDARVVSHVEDLVAEAVAAGAVRVNGGEANGVLMPATVVDRVTSSMRLFTEESFGPVVGITRAADEADAVRLANDTDYGLSAAVFTRDTARGLRVARQIKSGICHINGPTVHDEAQMPFGGVKASGYGRFGGKAGIDAFTDLRWITIETQPGHYPI